MNGSTIGYRQVVRVLAIVQEFIDTNPNEIPALADSKLLIEAIHAELNRKDEEPPDSGDGTLLGMPTILRMPTPSGLHREVPPPDSGRG